MQETEPAAALTRIDSIEQLIGPSIEDLGYELVRVRLYGARRPVLQVMAEPANGGPMNVDDCARISRTISALLDVEDPISGNYELEVSSPGIDRPLTRLKDFERYKGFEAKVELEQARDGRRRFSGLIEQVEGNDVTLIVDGEVFRLPFEAIGSAKLILTDELIENARLSAQAFDVTVDGVD